MKTIEYVPMTEDLETFRHSVNHELTKIHNRIDAVSGNLKKLTTTVEKLDKQVNGKLDQTLDDMILIKRHLGISENQSTNESQSTRLDNMEAKLDMIIQHFNIK